MICQLEAMSTKNLLKSAEVVKVTSKIIAKELRMWQETRVTKAGKIAEADVKKKATQKLQIKKAQKEELK